MSEQVEKPLPILPASLYRKDTDKDLNSVISLPLQRFSNRSNDTTCRQIPISLQENDKPAVEPTVNRKLTENNPKLDTMATTMDEFSQKSMWESDPLRLCLVDSSIPSSPVQLKIYDSQVEKNIIDSRLSSEQARVRTQLPDDDVATYVPNVPMPPPKLLLKTSLSILPTESYASLPLTAAESWTGNREVDQSLSAAASPTMASVFLFDEGEGNKKFTEETWDAIFHPLSTFKHTKSGLEYYAWNPANLPQAAARVAQRVNHLNAYDTEVPSFSNPTAEATIPRLMPTSSTTHSPELASNAEQNQENAITSVGQEEGYYYDMLQKIRGGQRYSHGSSIESQLYADGQDDRLSTKSDDGTHNEQRVKSDTAKQGLVARIASASSLTAIFLGNTNDEKKLHQEHRDPETLVSKKSHYWTEKRFFCIGFVCPLLWFYGSFQIRSSNRTKDPSDLRWQKRCRMAALYFSILVSLVVLVICVKAAGAAGIRQAQSDKIRAVIAN